MNYKEFANTLPLGLRLRFLEEFRKYHKYNGGLLKWLKFTPIGSNTLSGAFNWACTKAGHDFWAEKSYKYKSY